jgi:hypothetical protein
MKHVIKIDCIAQEFDILKLNLTLGTSKPPQSMKRLGSLSKIPQDARAVNDTGQFRIWRGTLPRRLD